MKLGKNKWLFLPRTSIIFICLSGIFVLISFHFHKVKLVSNPWKTKLNTHDVGMGNVSREESANKLPLNKRNLVILLNNRPAWLILNDPDIPKPCQYKCDFTDDRNRWDDSEAVVFVASEYPRVPKTKKKNGQIWILFTLESPKIYPSGFKQWKNLINWTMTYRLDSDIFTTYQEIKRKENIGYNPFNKSKPISWLVSNCNAQSKRDHFTKLLKKYIKIDVFGKCGDMKAKCKGIINSDCWRGFFRKYFFYLSFENSFCRDYITEKAYNPLNNSIVPIVRGKPIYSKFLPLHSYINTANFKTVESLSDYLKYLIKNETAYNSYFDWRKHYTARLYNRMPLTFCELCRRLHFKEKYIRWYQSLDEWWVTGAQCNDTIEDLHR